MSDTVRVLRILEYVGPREWVENTIARSIHGERREPIGGVIRAATLGTFPEILSPEESAHEAEKATQAEFDQTEAYRVQDLVDFADSMGLLPDHCYAFGDGVTVYAKGHELYDEQYGPKGPPRHDYRESIMGMLDLLLHEIALTPGVKDNATLMAVMADANTLRGRIARGQ